MKKKSRKSLLKPTLQRFELVPITDPAIQAALDELARQEKPVIPDVLREHARSQSRKWKSRQS